MFDLLKYPLLAISTFLLIVFNGDVLGQSGRRVRLPSSVDAEQQGLTFLEYMQCLGLFFCFTALNAVVFGFDGNAAMGAAIVELLVIGFLIG